MSEQDSANDLIECIKYTILSMSAYSPSQGLEDALFGVFKANVNGRLIVGSVEEVWMAKSSSITPLVTNSKLSTLPLDIEE